MIKVCMLHIFYSCLDCDHTVTGKYKDNLILGVHSSFEVWVLIVFFGVFLGGGEERVLFLFSFWSNVGGVGFYHVYLIFSVLLGVYKGRCLEQSFCVKKKDHDIKYKIKCKFFICYVKILKLQILIPLQSLR